MPDSNCIFCSILRGDIPSAEVYADENVVAFLDIGPVNKGHVLVVPRAHYATIFDIPADATVHITKAIQAVGKAIMQSTGAEGLNVLQNNYAAAGQMVFHVHWHIIPRFADDGLELWPQGQYDTPEDMKALAQKIKETLI